MIYLITILLASCGGGTSLVSTTKRTDIENPVEAGNISNRKPSNRRQESKYDDDNIDMSGWVIVDYKDAIGWDTDTYNRGGVSAAFARLKQYGANMLDKTMKAAMTKVENTIYEADPETACKWLFGAAKKFGKKAAELVSTKGKTEEQIKQEIATQSAILAEKAGVTPEELIEEAEAAEAEDDDFLNDIGLDQ